MIKRVLQTLLLTVMVAGFSAAQVTKTGDTIFTRAAIEAYPEAERRPLLDYLDGARVVADRMMRSYATGRDDELDGEFTRLARDRGQKIFIREYANMMRQTYGGVTSYSFRCQMLEAPAENPDAHDVKRARSIVYYTITTPKRPNGELHIVVKTMLIGNAHAASFFDIKQYRENTSPCDQGK